MALEAFLEPNEDSVWQQQCAFLPTVETDPDTLAAELRRLHVRQGACGGGHG